MLEITMVPVLKLGISELTSHQQLDHTKMGLWFKDPFERSVKRGINFDISQVEVQHVINTTTTAPKTQDNMALQ